MAQTIPPKGLWYRWKSLKLPWRRKRLVGQDLSGTTFWELHNPEAPWRPRRMALPSHGRQNLARAADLQLSPAWMQWLRHTRPVAPTLEEQHLDLQRQMQLKQLAAAADARWEQKPRIADRPEETAQVQPELIVPKDDTARPGPLLEHADERATGVGGTMSAVKDQVNDDVNVDGGARPQERSSSTPQSTPSLPHQSEQSAETSEETDKTNPWARQRANPGEEWQPGSWKPARAERR